MYIYIYYIYVICACVCVCGYVRVCGCVLVCDIFIIIYIGHSYFLYSFSLFSKGCSVIVGLLATLPRAASLQEFAGL